MIEIKLNLEDGEHSVKDNGLEIPTGAFMHSDVSKLSRSGLHYHRELFLISLGALSKLKIHSYTRKCLNSWQIHLLKAAHCSRLLQIDAHQAHKFDHDSGTKVFVSHLFENLPVRKKQQAKLKRHEFLPSFLENLRQALISILIAWPSFVSLTLYNAYPDTKEILKINWNSRLPIPRALSEVPFDNCQFNRWLEILHKSGHLHQASRSTWDHVSVKSTFITIHGAISTEPSASKRTQYISLLDKPIDNRQSESIWFKDINKIFKDSRFGDTEVVIGLSAQSGKNLHLDEERKGMNRWPMFIFNVDSTSTSKSERATDKHFRERDDIAMNGKRLFESLLDQWLVFHRFKSERQKFTDFDAVFTFEVENISHTGNLKTSAHEGCLSVSPTAERFAKPLSASVCDGQRKDFISASILTPCANSNYTFHILSKVICGKSCAQGAKRLDAMLLKNPYSSVVRPPVQSKYHKSMIACQGAVHSESKDTLLSWRDPETAEFCWVDRQTGFIKQDDHEIDNILRQASPARSSATRYLSRQIKDSKQRTSISDLLANWENPVFGMRDPIASDIEVGRPASLDNFFRLTSRASCSQSTVVKILPARECTYRINALDLVHARVIGPVDHKFVLIKVFSSLIVLDQHAADERCKLEKSLRSLVCTSKGDAQRTCELDKAIIFNVSKQENELLARSRSYFATWGVQYSLATTSKGVFDQDTHTGSNQFQISIDRVPTVIAEQCIVQKQKIINCLLSEVWTRYSDGSEWRYRESYRMKGQDYEKKIENQEKTGWVKKLDQCPRGILDMIKSRACRSAIMFNDILTLDECKCLVEDLAQCAFPFQCAHGRPSMIYLATIGH